MTMSAMKLRAPAGSAVAACLLLAASVFVSGCRSTPTGDLETLRTQPNLPDIHDIRKLALDWEWHWRDKATTERELDELRRRIEPSDYMQNQIDVRVRRRVELAAEARALDARRDVIVERVASDSLHARMVNEQLESDLAKRAGLARGLEERLLNYRLDGKDDTPGATKARAELVTMRRGIEHMQYWQNMISQASTGYARVSGQGWPVLDGEARRRLGKDESASPRSDDMEMTEEDEE